jgi:lipoate---protein ligase
MLFISDTTTDPYRNLAEEEYLLKYKSEPIFRLWRNDNAIIVGHYQNAMAEIDVDYVKEHDIKVVRRLTGGGAVFHDLGNINFTFIQERNPKEDTGAMFRRYTSPILDALNSLGIKAYLEGRNDLLIDGKKFSGNAVCIWKNRVLQHGTLLFDSSMNNLASALKSRPEKFIGKAVQSNRSRVTNIKEHLFNHDRLSSSAAISVQSPEIPQNPDVLWFKDFLGDYVCRHWNGNDKAVKYELSKAENEAVEMLKSVKYSRDCWNFGTSPEYSLSNIRKFSGGILEFYFTVNKGIITDLNIRGDYFFTAQTEDFIQQMIGTVHTKEAVTKKVSALNTDAYFANINSDDIVNMFF